MGAEKQAKVKGQEGDKESNPPAGFRNGKVSRQPTGQAPHRVPWRQGQQATTPLRPPSGHRNATPTPPRKRRSPPWVPLSTRKTSAARVQPRGCKGRSPLHKITFSLPLPAGKGVGGMGAEKQTKGRASRRQGKQALRRVPWRQGQQATKRTSPQKAHI